MRIPFRKCGKWISIYRPHNIFSFSVLTHWNWQTARRAIEIDFLFFSIFSRHLRARVSKTMTSVGRKSSQNSNTNTLSQWHGPRFRCTTHAISASIQVPLIHLSLSTQTIFRSDEAKQSADKYVSDNSIGESSKCHSMILMATAESQQRLLMLFVCDTNQNIGLLSIVPESAFLRKTNYILRSELTELNERDTRIPNWIARQHIITLSVLAVGCSLRPCPLLCDQ